MHPDMTNKTDALAHILSEIMNDAAPIGWERYRGAADCLLANFNLVPTQEHINRQPKILDAFPRPIEIGIDLSDMQKGFQRLAEIAKAHGEEIRKIMEAENEG